MSRSPEDMFAAKPSPKVARLREYYINATKRPEPNYNIFSDLAITRVMKQTEGEPMPLRRAKAFAAVVDAAPVDIFPDEPIVGWVAGDPISVQVCVEQRGARTEIELDHFRFTNEEDRKILQDEIIPYWKGDGNWKRHWFARAYQSLPPETRNILYGDPDPGEEKIAILTNSNPPAQPRVSGTAKVKTLGLGIVTDLMSRHHIGHSCFGYEKVLKKGFLGIKKDAEDRIFRLDLAEPEDMKKMAFLKGVVISMNAAASIGARFAGRAREMAATEADPARKQELLTIADTCDQVPAHQARTFREALQSVWFTQIMNWWETPLVLAVSPGRVDQYLYPYYQADIREGRLTKEEAQELIDCWLMRFSQGVAPFVPQSGAAFHIDVGGFHADGSDATNELSFMFLEGMMHARMIEPNIGVLVHSKTPDDFLIKACQLCSLGTGHPMFLNNDVFVENLLSRGTLGGPPVPIELARTSGAIGCNEPHVANHESDFNVGTVFQLPIVLEMALFNGLSRFHKKRMGLETGEATDFQSFEDLLSAFEKQLSFVAGHCGTAIRAFELAMAEVYPTVYQSALIEDCIEKGMPREAGGARFNFGPCVATLGATDVGDSLAAIKKLVFEEKRLTMAQLLTALETNFEGQEDIRELLLGAPKFGNDDDYVDELVAWLMDVFCKEVIKHKNTRGGRVLPYQNPLSGYVGMGRLMGALPSGRKAGEPLSDGVSPTRGSDVNGPTAVLNSAGKVDNIPIALGQTLNMRLSPEVVASDDGVYRLAAMLRTFVDLKIHHIQFNFVSSDILRAAQEKPDEYQDLMVRVAGYVAYFVNLSKGLQDSIIARTEHAIQAVRSDHGEPDGSLGETLSPGFSPTPLFRTIVPGAGPPHSQDGLETKPRWLGHKPQERNLLMEPRPGMIYGIERFALHDGPGIRTLVFMKGCPLRCLWCSSPQTQAAHQEITYDCSNCLTCGACADTCPKQALTFSADSGVRLDSAICDRCGTCLTVCPSKALQLVGKWVNPEALFKEVARDSAFFRRSKGGVTVGGGEPTFQAHFVAEFMKRCQGSNIHTAMETCGYCPRERLNKILEHTNLVFMDIKHMDDQEHQRLTGVSNGLILENARLVAQKRPLVLRVPTVPGLNDSEENIQATAKFAAQLGKNLLRMELLPYHQLGLGNYERLGRNYPLADVEPPTDERMELLRSLAGNFGIEARVPGRGI